MYTWKFQHLYGNEEFDPEFLQELCDTFNDGFGGMQDCSVEVLRLRLRECQLLGLLENSQDGAIYGCVMVMIPQQTLNGKHLIWGVGGFLRKSAQRKAVWRQILKDITACYPEKEFGWIGCRTQNPLMMRCYGLFGSLSPFEVDYTDAEGQQLIHYLRQHIPQVRDVEHFDATRGICYNVYSTGRMGDYPINLNGQIEQQLGEWGFNRESGDSLVVLARLPQPQQGQQVDSFASSHDCGELLVVAC